MQWSLPSCLPTKRIDLHFPAALIKPKPKSLPPLASATVTYHFWIGFNNHGSVVLHCDVSPKPISEIVMPLHMIPPTRRSFLQTTLVGGTALLASRYTGAAELKPSDDWWALLSDPHIDADPKKSARGITMLDCLNRIIDEVLAEPSPPAGVIINGDCAFSRGLAEDYATLSTALQRFADADLPLHMTMGNHDDRGPFYDAFASQRADNPLVDGKHVSILSTPTTNLFLMDSLWEVNKVTGELGQPQLDWLASALDAHAEKPAIVIGHHNLQFLPKESQATISGLRDSQKLVDLLNARSHVQAYIFGHTHHWNVREMQDEVNLVNLPACSYVFNPAHPNGWVKAKFGADQFALELRALDHAHPQHGEKHEIRYALAANAR
ncbi:metallophosphoesterase family protein [Novipirellula sp. SH528]|uniref:metallophosphoesterase family protein n=1 Tax=Novipirellula sp. SH528 TaxID=3454466 RepID=UPI003F9EF41D